MMMTLSSPNQSKIVIADLADTLHGMQWFEVEHGVVMDV
jgi:hypothetical protein